MIEEYLGERVNSYRKISSNLLKAENFCIVTEAGKYHVKVSYKKRGKKKQEKLFGMFERASVPFLKPLGIIEADKENIIISDFHDTMARISSKEQYKDVMLAILRFNMLNKTEAKEDIKKNFIWQLSKTEQNLARDKDVPTQKKSRYRDSLRILRSEADSVEFMLTHGDLKPANVCMIDGKDLITDFEKVFVMPKYFELCYFLINSDHDLKDWVFRQLNDEGYNAQKIEVIYDFTSMFSKYFYLKDQDT